MNDINKIKESKNIIKEIGFIVEKKDSIDWKFIIEFKCFFNQLFSTFYSFNENQLDQFYEKLEVGTSRITDDMNIICDTKFGLIYNKKIHWTNFLKEKYHKKPELIAVTENRDIYSFEIDLNNPPLELLEEMEGEKWFKEWIMTNNCFPSEEGGHSEEESNYDQLVIDVESLNNYYHTIISKLKFSNKEIIEIIKNGRMDYFFNIHFYNQVIIKLNSDINDFSISKFYDTF